MSLRNIRSQLVPDPSGSSLSLSTNLKMKVQNNILIFLFLSFPHALPAQVKIKGLVDVIANVAGEAAPGPSPHSLKVLSRQLKK
jgi:hypothetical protein